MNKNYHIDKQMTPIIKAHPFKGNTIQITQKNDLTSKDNGTTELHIVNSYYSGCVRQAYISEMNITRLVYHNFPYTSKWYNNKMRNDFNNVTLLFKLPNSNLEIECNEYQAVVRNNSQHKGMFFKGNIDNITQLKRLNELFKDFRKTFKYNTAEDILSLIDLKEDNTSKLKYIDFRKYFSLPMNK